jgi:ligand-binding sensor domain-containing protein
MKWKLAILQLLNYFFIPVFILAQASGSSENFTVKEGLSENVVHCLLQDKKGFIWIGTHEGLNRYDGYEFKKFLHDKNDSTSLPNSPIEGLYETEDGDLLVQTASSLTRMDQVTNRFSLFKLSHPDYLKIANQHNPTGRVFNIMNFGIDASWIYTNSNLGKSLTSGIKRNLSDRKSLLALYFDPFKRLWLLDQDRLTAIDEYGNKSTILTGFYITDTKLLNWFIDDLNGNLWLRIERKLFCIDKKTLQIKTVVGQDQLGTAVENVSTLLLDRSGILWVGSFYGLKKINLSRQKFRSIVHSENGKGLVNNFVLGLNIYSGNKLNVQHYYLDSFYTEIELPSHIIKRYKVEDKTAGKMLKELLIRQNEESGKSDIDKQVQKIKSFNHDWKTFRYAYKDREGVIWSNHEYRLINYQDGRMIYKSGEVEQLWDDNRFLWVATSQQGLIRFNKTTREIKYYMIDNTVSSAISSNELLCLLPDNKENLWIGTRGGGLNYFDKEKETFIHYTQANGLSNNTIYCMIMDDQNNLWMGTANGLSCFNTASKKFRNYYSSDGLINTEFNRWSAVKDENGYLYFGGMHGIDYFKPGEVLLQQNPQIVVQLTGFKTGNHSMPLQDGILLHHKQNYIRFEFAAMDFRNPLATQYKYMLEGSNNEWIDNGHDHAATFAALRPGKYVFRVKATTQNGLWSNEALFPFIIKTPWWQTKGFYTLCGLVVIAVLYSLYRFRINQLRKLYAVRNKISQDLHDEVGATLSSIHVYSSVASKAMSGDAEKAQDALTQINTNTRQVMENMNDIVWAMHTGNKGEISFESKLKNYGYELLTPLNINCTYHINKETEKQLTSIEARKNLLLIAKEALNNISKHSNATEASVQLMTTGKNLLLEITDDGKGLSGENRRQGNGLQNMKSRVDVLNGQLEFMSKNGNGTHIRCTIPLTSIRD